MTRLSEARGALARSGSHPGQWIETSALRQAVKLLIAEVEDLRAMVLELRKGES